MFLGRLPWVPSSSSNFFSVMAGFIVWTKQQPPTYFFFFVSLDKTFLDSKNNFLADCRDKKGCF